MKGAESIGCSGAEMRGTAEGALRMQPSLRERSVRGGSGGLRRGGRGAGEGGGR